MKLQDYQEQSKRTMPFNGNPQNPIEFTHMFGNYAMGLVGEAIEAMTTYKNMSVSDATSEGLAKELGDVAHYVVGLAALLDLPLPSKVDVGNYSKFFSIEYLTRDLVDEAGLIVEHAKKVIYHSHALDNDFIKIRLNEILKLISDIANDEGYDLSQIFQMNIDKLKTRYPEKFNSADSIARVDV